MISFHCIAQENILEQKIKFSKKKEAIQFFLNEIEEKLNIQFLYDNSKINTEQKVTIENSEQTVRSFLKNKFQKDIEIIIKGKSIILKNRAKNQSKKAGAKATIKGYIKEKESDENLIGAHAFHVEGLSGTISNNYGFYSITLPVGKTTLNYSYVGYQNNTISFNLQKDTIINNSLGFDLMDELIISSEKPIPVQETTEMGVMRLSSKQLKSRPAVGGEVDILKVIQLLPGVQSGREGSSALYVRGGGPDQNLILLDGVPIYNVSHLFGFMSVFNADAINNVKLIKGAFPARYGGRLSSVIDISMKEGNANEVKGEGSIGFVASKLTVEGPIKNGKTSFIISGRRTYIDILARPLLQTETVDIDLARNKNRRTTTENGYYFYDLNAKINHRYSDKDRIYFSTYTGKDRGFKAQTSTDKFNTSTNFIDENYQETDNRLTWGSTIALMRWNHVISPKTFSNLSISYSKYDFDSEHEEYRESKKETDTTSSFQNFKVVSGIKDWSVQLDFDFYPNPNHYIRYGIKGVAHEFSPNIVARLDENKKDTTYNREKVRPKEFSFYIEDDVKISRKMKTNIGIHVSGFKEKEVFYKSIQPRVSFRYLINKDLSLKGAYTRMTQFLHLLTNAGVGLPTDFWVPATDRVKPQKSNQYVLGIAYTHPTKDFEMTVESYYKTMDNLIEYKEGAQFLNLSENWQDKIESGIGTSYGVEFFIKKSFAKTNGWIGYTLSWADRTFENLNFGKTFPFRYDRRHDISLVINHQLSDKILLSANWVFGTGNSITLPVASFNGVNNNIIKRTYNGYGLEQYNGRNSVKMRSYHRADASIRFHKKKKWGNREWVISIYNVYNRRNAFSITHTTEWNEETQSSFNKFKENTLFPIIPSISYRFKF